MTRGRRESPRGAASVFEILKIVQGLGDGVAAVEKCPLSAGRSKKASLVAIGKVVCGRPSSTFFGLGAGSTIRRQALTKDEARRITANVAKLPEPTASNVTRTSLMSAFGGKADMAWKCCDVRF